MPSKEYLKVVNWDQLQHYKKRNPPWIWLYVEYLELYEFTSLPDETKFHLFAIWLLASRVENLLPNDPDWIKARIGAKSRIKLDLLIEKGFLAYADASDMLATSKQDATPETETETETYTESDSKRFTPPTLNQVSDYILLKSLNVDPQRFIDFYQSKNWMVGKNKMKDWQASLRNWGRNTGVNQNQSFIEQHSDRSWAN